MKYLATVIILFLTIHTCVGQKGKNQDYQAFYKKADSINKLGKHLILDNALTSKLKQLDKLLPMEYYSSASQLLEANKFEEASIVYYVGYLRHKYCCIAKSNYAPNQDWAVAESMQASFGKNIILFLKTNIDTYVSVINLVTDYCQKNDYLLLPNQKNSKLYNSPIETLVNLKTDFLKNKDNYTKQWNEERGILLSTLK